MKFVVNQPLTAPDRSSVPSVIPETNNLIPPAISLLTARLRTVTAGEIAPGMPLLGDAVALRDFMDPATETPQLGSTEAWAMRNYSPDTHPIHEHLVELDWSGGGRRYSTMTPAQLLSVGAFQPAGAFESGPKDTFVSPKNMITVWVGTYTIGGTSVWHCHILSHEDAFMMEMMRPLVVGNAPQTQLPSGSHDEPARPTGAPAVAQIGGRTYAPEHRRRWPHRKATGVRLRRALPSLLRVTR